ncbi:MAG: hypothetical protein ACYTGV_15615, partial [Planctomycetota bacterium]
ACTSGGPARDYEEWKKQMERPPDAPPPMWKQGNHPSRLIYGSGSTGSFSYKTSGSTANRNERVDAQLYRFGYLGRSGLMIDWLKSEEMTGGTTAEAFDAFGFGNFPLWPNNRLRFMSRPGLYYNNINLKSTLPNDVEPWSWGLRYELETEVDVIKQPKFILSLFGSGRIGFGWGDAKMGGVKQGINATDWGYEAGVRAHWSRGYLALSWIDRTMEVDGGFGFSTAEYRYEGLNLSLGLRW